MFDGRQGTELPSICGIEGIIKKTECSIVLGWWGISFVGLRVEYLFESLLKFNLKFFYPILKL